MHILSHSQEHTDIHRGIQKHKQMQTYTFVQTPKQTHAHTPIHTPKDTNTHNHTQT